MATQPNRPARAGQSGPGAPRPKREQPLSTQLAKALGTIIVLVIAVLITRYCGSGRDIHFKVADRVAAIDGETLRSANAEVRLYGIDAPQLAQTCTGADGKPWACGKAAQARLKALIGRYAVDCRPRGHDAASPVTAVCRTSKVPDLGEALVRDGLATNARGETEGPYAAAESEAKAAKRGLWQGNSPGSVGTEQ